MRSFFVLCFLVILGGGWVFGQKVPEGYTLPPTTLSPDQRYGVLVPKIGDDGEDPVDNAQNQVIEVKTGLILGAINVPEVAFDRMNHGVLAPTIWSSDDSMLLWQLDEKWGYAAVNLVRIENGKIAWQSNVLQTLQQEMLKRTRAANPPKYAAVKAKSGEFGSWFKDGFAIDCVLVNQGGLKFPLLFHVFLTSNTKQIEGYVNLDSRMTAEVNQDGTITVKDFHLGTQPPSRSWE